MLKYEDIKDEILRQVCAHPVLGKFKIYDNFHVFNKTFNTRFVLKSYDEKVSYIFHFFEGEWFMNMRILDPNEFMSHRLTEFSSCWCNSTKGSICEMYDDLQDKLQDIIERKQKHIDYLKLILERKL